jgi:hypothetical protein
MMKLGDVSLAAGLLSGKGAIGKLVDKAGFGLGLVPGLMAQQRKKKRDAAGREVDMTPAEAAATGMKKGGKVKASFASKRADGCCVKGKTKGKMV